jgi:acyl-CoA thioesterase-1
MNRFCVLAVLALAYGCGRETPEQTATIRTDMRDSSGHPVNSPDLRPVIACFGDSLTAGFGLDPGQSYPDLVQKELDSRDAGYHVVNFGVSGDTTQDGLARLPLVLEANPKIVVLELGANDGLRGLPVAGTRANLEQIVVALQRAGARIVLAAITLPPNYGPEYIRNFDAIYRDLAAQYKTEIIPFLLQGVAGHDALMQRDGLHPNAEGTKHVAQTVTRALEPLLKRS